MQIKQHKLITTISLCSFLFILSFLCLGLSPELLPSSSSAASSTATINVSIPDNISIELSKTNLNIDLAISGGVDVFGSDSTNVEVSTNNYTGYTLSMTDNDTTPTDNTSLIRQKLDPTDPTEPDASIPTIEQDIAGGYTSDTMTASHWGYSIDSSTTGYKAVPPLSATNIIKTTTSASLSDSTPVYFGVKAAPTLMPGTYKSTVIFTAVANYQPSQNNAITAISPTTISTDGGETLTIDTNIDYSENLVDATHPLNVSLVKVSDTSTTLSCGSVALVNNSDKLRITCTTPTTGIEETNYTVQLVFTKLGDLTYNSEDTIAGEIPGPPACTVGSVTGIRLEDGNCWMTSDLATNITWYYAMGASSTSATSGGSSSTTTAFSVTGHCPSGWYMPTKAQFDTLISKYGSGGTLYTTLGLSSNRDFWSATQSNSSYAYYLYVVSSSADVYGSNKASRNSYYAIRCVAP